MSGGRMVAALVVAVLLGGVAVASASARYDLLGTWQTTSVSGGGASADFTISKMDLATGKFSGTGVAAGLVLAGTEAGDSVTYTQTEGAYVSYDSATLTVSGGYLEMVDGRWHDTNGSSGTFTARIRYSGSGSTGAATPVLAQSVAGSVISGTVTVERPGTNSFVTLAAPGLIPVGSLVNATNGRVRLTAAASAKGVTHSGQFYDGEFRLGQARSGLTTLTLAGGTPCAGSASAGRHAPTRRQKLWGSAHGTFETIGTDAAATELGTRWLTEDTCSETVIRVRGGAVKVTDFVHHRSVVVRAPHSYVARPGGA